MRVQLEKHPKKWKRLLKKAAVERVKTNISKYNAEEQVIRLIMVGARQRCTNRKDAGWDRYGGRGIEFRFESVEEATRWVYKNLGAKPKGRYSIDRIDNNRHYEPGNLRWATDVEQARNKGLYRRSENGERMRKLVLARPDYTPQGLWRYVRAGYSDEYILTMKKPPGGRKRKNVATGL